MVDYLQQLAQAYRNLDVRLGGYLPGGLTPQQVQEQQKPKDTFVYPTASEKIGLKNSFVMTAAPNVQYVSPTEIQKQANANYLITGLTKGNDIFLPPNPPPGTLMHELGHFDYPGTLISSMTSPSITSEGEKILREKYNIPTGPILNYAPSTYPSEGTAELAGWLRSGKISENQASKDYPSTMALIQQIEKGRYEGTINPSGMGVNVATFPQMQISKSPPSNYYTIPGTKITISRPPTAPSPSPISSKGFTSGLTYGYNALKQMAAGERFGENQANFPTVSAMLGGRPTPEAPPVQDVTKMTTGQLLKEYYSDIGRQIVGTRAEVGPSTPFILKPISWIGQAVVTPALEVVKTATIPGMTLTPYFHYEEPISPELKSVYAKSPRTLEGLKERYLAGPRVFLEAEYVKRALGKQTIQNYENLVKDYNQLGKDYEAGKITAQEYTDKTSVIQADKDWKIVSQYAPYTSFGADLRAKGTPGQRIFGEALSSTVQIVPWMISPYTSAVMGAEQIGIGAKEIEAGDKLGGAIRLGIGAIPFAGLGGPAKTISPTSPFLGKIGYYGLGAGVTGASVYFAGQKSGGDIPTMIGAAIGSAGSFFGPQIYRDLTREVLLTSRIRKPQATFEGMEAPSESTVQQEGDTLRVFKAPGQKPGDMVTILGYDIPKDIAATEQTSAGRLTEALPWWKYSLAGTEQGAVSALGLPESFVWTPTVDYMGIPRGGLVYSGFGAGEIPDVMKLSKQMGISPEEVIADLQAQGFRYPTLVTPAESMAARREVLSQISRRGEAFIPGVGTVSLTPSQATAALRYTPAKDILIITSLTGTREIGALENPLKSTPTTWDVFKLGGEQTKTYIQKPTSYVEPLTGRRLGLTTQGNIQFPSGLSAKDWQMAAATGQDIIGLKVGTGLPSSYLTKTITETDRVIQDSRDWLAHLDFNDRQALEKNNPALVQQIKEGYGPTIFQSNKIEVNPRTGTAKFYQEFKNLDKEGELILKTKPTGQTFITVKAVAPEGVRTLFSTEPTEKAATEETGAVTKAMRTRQTALSLGITPEGGTRETGFITVDKSLQVSKQPFTFIEETNFGNEFNLAGERIGTQTTSRVINPLKEGIAQLYVDPTTGQIGVNVGSSGDYVKVGQSIVLSTPSDIALKTGQPIFIEGDLKALTDSGINKIQTPDGSVYNLVSKDGELSLSLRGKPGSPFSLTGTGISITETPTPSSFEAWAPNVAPSDLEGISPNTLNAIKKMSPAESNWYLSQAVARAKAGASTKLSDLAKYTPFASSLVPAGSGGGFGELSLYAGTGYEKTAESLARFNLKSTPIPIPILSIFPAYIPKSIFGGSSIGPSVSALPFIAPVSTPTLTPVTTPVITPIITPTTTPTIVPTITPTIVPTMKPTLTPVSTPVVTPTLTPVITPVVTPTVTPTITLTPTPPWWLLTPRPYPPAVGVSKKRKRIPLKKVRAEPGYYVLTRKRKKPVLISPQPLSKGQALAFGLAYTKKTERATFSLVPTTRAPTRINIRPVSEQEIWRAGYRPPVRKGRIVPSNLVYIQKRSTRLGTPLEVRAVQSYKKRGKSIW